MNKSELVDALASRTGQSKVSVKAVLDALTEEVVQTLKKGEDVCLIGFGAFKTSMRTARTGRNPATGATIKIPASRQVKFVASKSLKDAVK